MKKMLFLCLCSIAAVFGLSYSSIAVPNMQRRVPAGYSPSSSGCIPPRIPYPIEEKSVQLLTHTCDEKCASSKEKNASVTHVVCILDRSGSMARLTDDTIGGYNTFIQKQADASDKAQITTVLFDDKYEFLHENVPVRDLKPITRKEYYARGTTALLDALGSSILRMTASLEKKDICPKSAPVIFMVITDGLENASREFSRATVKRLVSDSTEKYGWQFIFMGANIDSVAEAESIGIQKEHAMNFGASRKGLEKMYRGAALAVRSFCDSGAVCENWQEAQEPASDDQTSADQKLQQNTKK